MKYSMQCCDEPNSNKKKGRDAEKVRQFFRISSYSAGSFLSNTKNDPKMQCPKPGFEGMMIRQTLPAMQKRLNCYRTFAVGLYFYDRNTAKSIRQLQGIIKAIFWCCFLFRRCFCSSGIIRSSIHNIPSIPGYRKLELISRTKNHRALRCHTPSQFRCP